MEDTDRQAGEGNNVPQGHDKWARLACRRIARNRCGHNEKGVCPGGDGGKAGYSGWSQIASKHRFEESATRAAEIPELVWYTKGLF